MPSFIHIITTRFNVPTKTWDITRDGTKTLTNAWLEDRFDIFLKYCLPSFQNQSLKSFVWLVFFDTQTPEKYLKIIAEIRREFPVFTPVYVSDFDEMTQRLQEIIPTYFLSDTQFLLTTDIDNDDMLHKNFVQEVQNRFQPVHDLVIDMRLGLQLTKLNNNKAFVNHFFQVASPFVSLVENSSNFKTVTKERHLNYRNYPNLVFQDKEPMFIQFIHENNLVNATMRNNKRLAAIQYSYFGISPENEFTISKISTFVYNIKRSLKTLVNLITKNNNDKRPI